MGIGQSNIDYHITVDRTLLQRTLSTLTARNWILRLTATTIEAFQKGVRVADMPVPTPKAGYTTLKEHMP